MTTPPFDLPALQDIAKAATKGPWTAKPYSYGVQDGRIRVTSPSDSGLYNLAEDVTEADAAHIAAFDPPTALALIRDLEGAQEATKTVADLAKASNEWNVKERAKLTARAEAAEAKVARVRKIVDNDGIEVDTRDYGSMLAVNADDISVALEDPASDGTP